MKSWSSCLASERLSWVATVHRAQPPQLSTTQMTLQWSRTWLRCLFSLWLTNRISRLHSCTERANFSDSSQTQWLSSSASPTTLHLAWLRSRLKASSLTATSKRRLSSKWLNALKKNCSNRTKKQSSKTFPSWSKTSPAVQRPFAHSLKL